MSVGRWRLSCPGCGRKAGGFRGGSCGGELFSRSDLARAHVSGAVEYLEGVETGEVSGEGVCPGGLLDVLGEGRRRDRRRCWPRLHRSSQACEPLTPSSIERPARRRAWIAEDLSVLADAAFAPAA